MNIEGIVLTDKARKTLLELQAEDNATLKCYIRDLTNVAKQITIDGQYDAGNAKEALDSVALIFIVNEMMESLFAEQEGGDE